MRIFVNHVDEYIGKHLVADLRSVVGVQNHIFGTLSDPKGKVPPVVKRIVPRGDTPRQLLKSLLTCRVVVFDLATADLDELLLLLKVLKITKLEHEMVLILISSVMVWSRTKKQLVQTDPDAVQEEDGEPLEMMPEGLVSEAFARRLPESSYARWKTAETLVLSLNAKENLKTHVVCPGLLYGCDETTLFDSFQASWLSMKTAQIISAGEEPRLAAGKNYVPTVHVRDLARLVSNLSLGGCEQSYLVCVDRSQAQQADLVKGIVDKVGEPYEVPVVSPSDWTPPLPEAETLSLDYLDHMKLDLRFEPCQMMLAPDFAWYSEKGLVSNIEMVTDEFCRWRNLRPIRLMLSGPPAAGKTRFAAALAEIYGLKHIKAGDFIAWGKRLAEAEALSDKEEKDEFWMELHQTFNPEVEEPAEGEDAVEPKPIRLSLDQEVELARRTLQKNVCKFRGFVLDGYPRSYEAAQKLFFQPPAEDGEEEEKKPEFDARICPEYFVLLDPPLDERRDRAMAMDQLEVDGSHNNAADFTRREAAYQATNNNPDGAPSLMDFFTDNEIECLQVEFSTNIVEAIRLLIEAKGRAWNYMKQEREEAVEALDALTAGVHQREAEALRAKQVAENAENAVRAQRQEEEAARVRMLQQAEKDHLEDASRPLKKYLERNVVPILTTGLLETCQVMPEDPVEYLAEYLFTHANDLEVHELQA